MNVYDSERMAEVLEPLGYQQVDSPDGADMVILNTCHIREKATEKVFADLGRLKKIKQRRAHQGESMIIAVAGCVAQAESEEITRRAPYVDMVFGPQTYHRLPQMIAQATRASDPTDGPGQGVLDVEFSAEPKFDHLPARSQSTDISAFLTIQEGCDKFCHFCCVPYTRGAEYSRPVTDIENEAKQLIARGAKEITLLGQNVNAYHGLGVDGSDEWGLGKLMRRLASIEGLKRIRYTTSHPRDVDNELIAAHREIPQVMPYIHLPVQSGSDRILKAMNRKHTANDYLRIIDQFRTARPDIAFSSDFIVGYPGETDQDFADTMKLVEQVTFVQAYSFKYSRRPGTTAAALEDQIPEEIKLDRLTQLQTLLRQQQLDFNKSQIGSVQTVLLGKIGRQDEQLVGHSAYQQTVHVKAPQDLLGQMVDVSVTTVTMKSLTGTIV